MSATLTAPASPRPFSARWALKDAVLGYCWAQDHRPLHTSPGVASASGSLAKAAVPNDSTVLMEEFANKGSWYMLHNTSRKCWGVTFNEKLPTFCQLLLAVFDFCALL